MFHIPLQTLIVPKKANNMNRSATKSLQVPFNFSQRNLIMGWSKNAIDAAACPITLTKRYWWEENHRLSGLKLKTLNNFSNKKKGNVDFNFRRELFLKNSKLAVLVLEIFNLEISGWVTLENWLFPNYLHMGVSFWPELGAKQNYNACEFLVLSINALLKS